MTTELETLRKLVDGQDFKTLRRDKEMDADKTIITLLERVERYEMELNRLIKYANWQMGEGKSFHPTLPSAVNSAEQALEGVEDK